MSNTEKRRRGRPIGSGKNDQNFLIQVAERMVADANLTMTAAINRVIETRLDRSATDETLRRRLQRKWKASGKGLLAAARSRAVSVARRHDPSIDHDLARNIQSLQETLYGSPLVEFFEQEKALQEQIKALSYPSGLSSLINPLRQFEDQMNTLARALTFDPFLKVRSGRRYFL